MKIIAYVALASAAALILTACGSSDSASEQATAENVEMPVEEAMTDLDPAATPVAAASLAASDAARPAPAASAAAEQATKDAEKKM